MENKEMMLFKALTDPGKQRTENEDNYICETIWNQHTYLFAVIDGVGGYEGGKQAANIACESIRNYLTIIRNGEREQLLREVLVTANNKIIEAKLDEPRLRDMGCVVSCCLVDVLTWKLSYAHVGDTRIYEFRQGVLKKISHDHSLVGYREEAGELTEEEAMRHPQRNIIARQVGEKLRNTDADDFVESGTFSLVPDTRLLLCSDGLTDMITSASVTDILNGSATIEEKTQQLIDAANEAGGHDNITVLLAHFLPAAAATAAGVATGHKPTGKEKLLPENEAHVSADTAPERGNQTRAGRLKKNMRKIFLKEWWHIPVMVAALLLLADLAARFLIKSPSPEAVNIYMTGPSGTLQQRLSTVMPHDTLTHFFDKDTLMLEHPLIMDIDSVAWLQKRPLVVKPGAHFDARMPAVVIMAQGICLKNIRFTGFKNDIWAIGAAFSTDSADTSGDAYVPTVKTWYLNR